MDKLYFALFLVAFVVFLIAAFSGSTRRNVAVAWLPLGLAVWVLVYVIQSYRAI